MTIPPETLQMFAPIVGRVARLFSDDPCPEINITPMYAENQKGPHVYWTGVIDGMEYTARVYATVPATGRGVTVWVVDVERFTQRRRSVEGTKWAAREVVQALRSYRSFDRLSRRPVEEQIRAFTAHRK